VVQIATYLRLTVLTAGTLLPFFWIVVILGHRRKRNFERIFFFLCLALVFFFGGSLLALNAQLFYPQIPGALERFAWVVVCVGLWGLPSLLVHLHVEYADIREMFTARAGRRAWVAGAYAPAILLGPAFYEAARAKSGLDFELPSNSFGVAFQGWLLAAILICAIWQIRFLRAAPEREQRAFHRNLEIYFLLLAAWIFAAHAYLRLRPAGEAAIASYGALLALFALAPLIQLLRNVQKFNFLQIGRQRNLLYAVFAVFVALLYLSLIRRVSQWLEPYFPPEATAALLLFLPVAFFEPLQRLVGRILRRTAQSEMDRVQRLTAEIQQEARHGDLRRLVQFVERQVKETFELAEVKVSLQEMSPISEAARQFAREAGFTGELKRGEPRCRLVVLKEGQRAYATLGNVIAVMCVRSHGAAISGETEAALEFLCEQLPGALDLCRLIEEKLRLERELAERERLAVLGQMAASISHNLKNPLGSIKTILQVQLESEELPEGMRAETRMVLDEISRLSAKLSQLLQFSRPAVRGGTVEASCDARAVADEVGGVLRHEAERRGVALEVAVDGVGARVAASAEAVNEILSNLVVNALEATPHGGRVSVSGGMNGEGFLFSVEDDGHGVAESAREKILQPFFTTKTQGTGLGLAIVARRVAEFGGKLDFESPIGNERGTRFKVVLPLHDQVEPKGRR
jgi:two-component system, NtrC family, sensor histidine kinase HydH